MASGSATGNPRNKVALKPGHSLMDWIRLGNSGKDLTGVNGAFINVTKSELADHKSMEDAWLSIRGVVYNVTHYMDFHPGGCEELMRGVGTDATALFNEVHSWVNYESILKKCVVGRLGSSAEGDIFTAPTSPNGKKTVEKSQATVDWYQQMAFLVLVFHQKAPIPQVQLSLSEPDLLKCKVDGKLQTFNLEGKVRWPCYVSLSANGKLQVKLIKRKPVLWKLYGTVTDKCNTNDSCSAESSESDYWSAQIIKIVKLTHDTHLIKLKYNCDLYNYISPGCHVFIKQSVKGEDVIRPYTPVPMLPVSGSCSSDDWRETNEDVNLLVKAYPLGQMSSWLCSRRTGSTIFISDPKGSFTVNAFDKFKCIYLLAAGTGLTPMISLIVWLLRTSSDKQINLLFFNKTRKDIIWQKELEDLANEHSRFTVEHVLSEPDSEWSGRRGHVTFDLVQTLLPHCSAEIPATNFTCICGPRPFTLSIEKWLKEDLGYTHENYYSFLGQ